MKELAHTDISANTVWGQYRKMFILPLNPRSFSNKIVGSFLKLTT